MNNLLVASGDVFRMGIIGDLHTHFDDVDIAQIGALDYDLVFFIGDLGGGTSQSSLQAARLIARLHETSLVMPGNNDTYDIDQLAAELGHQQGLNTILSITGTIAESGNIRLCGYSHHRLEVADYGVSLIAARPHSMGGPDLTFPDYMATTYGVHSMAESEHRLRQLVDEAAQDIIFIGHNGPVGLGDKPSDMWGCDFRAGGGDWGDTDLGAVIGYAQSIGKRVRAVIAGHMHLRTKQGEQRPWHRQVAGVDYVNAARVPRIFSANDEVYRHHVALEISAQELSFSEILLPQYG